MKPARHNLRSRADLLNQSFIDAIKCTLHTFAQRIQHFALAPWR